MIPIGIKNIRTSFYCLLQPEIFQNLKLLLNNHQQSFRCNQSNNHLIDNCFITSVFIFRLEIEILTLFKK